MTVEEAINVLRLMEEDGLGSFKLMTCEPYGDAAAEVTGFKVETDEVWCDID